MLMQNFYTLKNGLLVEVRLLAEHSKNCRHTAQYQLRAAQHLTEEDLQELRQLDAFMSGQEVGICQLSDYQFDSEQGHYLYTALSYCDSSD